MFGQRGRSMAWKFGHSLPPLFVYQVDEASSMDGLTRQQAHIQAARVCVKRPSAGVVVCCRPPGATVAHRMPFPDAIFHDNLAHGPAVCMADNFERQAGVFPPGVPLTSICPA
jgi:hypothetical protein